MSWSGRPSVPRWLDVATLPPGVDLLAPRVLLAGGEAEGLGHVPHRRLGPVRDDVRDLRRVVPPVQLVHVLDDLLPALGLDVEVDVGRPVALGRQEALEQEAEGDGIGLGDAERVADGAVRRAPAALAVDVGFPAEADDLPDDQEVAGVTEGLDHVELVVDRHPGPAPDVLGHALDGLAGAGPVVPLRPLLGQVAEVAHLVVSLGAHERGQLGGHQREVEGGGEADLGRPLDHAGVAVEPPGHLGAGPEVGPGRGGKPRVELVQAAPGPHRRHRGGERPPGRDGVVHVPGGDAGHVVAVGQRREGVVAGRVERVAVVPQLHDHALAPEPLDQPPQLPTRRSRPVGHQGGGHQALAAAREHPPAAGADLGQRRRGRTGAPPSPPPAGRG